MSSHKMRTLPLAFCVVAFTLRLKVSAMASDMSIDQLIVASMSSSYPRYEINGSMFKCMELDMLSSESIWNVKKREPDSNAGVRKRSNNAVRGPLLWNDARIPYRLEAHFIEEESLRLQQAMKEYKKYTCVEFQEATASDNDSVTIVGTEGCSSAVGRQQGRQRLSLALLCRKIPVMLHELGHVIGLQHEHSRSDRDDYIHVNLTTVSPEYVEDVIKLDWTEWYDDGIPYDYRSIMHYSQTFGAHRQRVITTKDPRYQNVIGRPNGLSFRDVKRINKLYTCAGRNRCTYSVCRGEGFVGKDCQCWCPSRNVTIAAEHCNGSESLLYVEDTFQDVLNMSTSGEKSDSQSPGYSQDANSSTFVVPTTADRRFHLPIPYFLEPDYHFRKLILLSKTVELFSEYTHIEVFVHTYGNINDFTSGNKPNEVLVNRNVSLFINKESDPQLSTFVRECIKVMPEGFYFDHTVSCLQLRWKFDDPKCTVVVPTLNGYLMDNWIRLCLFSLYCMIISSVMWEIVNARELSEEEKEREIQSRLLASAFAEKSNAMNNEFFRNVGEDAITEMVHKLSDNIKRFNHLRHKLASNQKKLEELKTHYEYMLKDASDAVTTDAGESEDAVRLRNLENRLDKALLKCTAAEHIDKSYRQIKAMLEEISDAQEGHNEYARHIAGKLAGENWFEFRKSDGDNLEPNEDPKEMELDCTMHALSDVLVMPVDNEMDMFLSEFSYKRQATWSVPFVMDDHRVYNVESYYTRTTRRLIMWRRSPMLCFRMFTGIGGCLDLMSIHMMLLRLAYIFPLMYGWIPEYDKAHCLDFLSEMNFTSLFNIFKEFSVLTHIVEKGFIRPNASDGAIPWTSIELPVVF